MSRLVARFDVRYPSFHLTVGLDLPTLGITVLFGPSGSGKTTLLRCLAGLERAPDGFMQFGNDVWQDEANGMCLPLYARPIGTYFRSLDCSPIIVCVPICFTATNAYLRKNAVFRSSKWSLFLESSIFLNAASTSYPVESNNGWRSVEHCSRVPNCCYWMSRLPRSIFSASKKSPFIHRLYEELRIPVIYVSHAINEILQLADRVVLLKEGNSWGSAHSTMC